MRSDADNGDRLVVAMAETLQSLTAGMLDSGTARWSAYDRAGLINFADRVRSDPTRINAQDGIVHTALDHAAVSLAKTGSVSV